MMKLTAIATGLALALPLTSWAGGRSPGLAPSPAVVSLPPAGQALNSVVVPAPMAQEAPGRRLRESLRQPWIDAPSTDPAPYRLSDTERRKMRDMLRSRAQEDPLR
ncbi:MAG: hypothetical protein ACLGG8_05350 [Gammaproteobacteria bacterium]